MNAQPTFPNGPPVPLMVEGVLDATGLRQLFADLLAATTGLSAREKGLPTTYADPDESTATTARDRLLGGQARAVQLRYHFDGHDWTDTVLALPTGFRVVRCRHDPGP